jgi:hypothetical protein
MDIQHFKPGLILKMAFDKNRKGDDNALFQWICVGSEKNFSLPVYYVNEI